MNIAKLVDAKTAGHAHTPDEIRSIIHAYARGDVSDVDMSQWMKAVHSQGMSDEETIGVVDAMITSGETMDFSHLRKFVADKHSTGGVGDKVSLILGPLMAAAGLAIPMITGRSLGHTGGTLDKLESIPGYRTNLPHHEFRKVVEKVGISMIGPTDEICPADKKMYALRDALGIVKSIPLICGSIMSKKIAEGIQGLVLDVKVGNGAFIETVTEAKRLGEKLAMVGDRFGVSTEIIYSDMNQPLGHEAGLQNEIRESIRTLQGQGPEDLAELTYKLGQSLLILSGVAGSSRDARKTVENLIQNGSAFRKLVEMVEAHGGDASLLEIPEKLLRPRFLSEVRAHRSGYVIHMDTLRIGRIVNGLTVLTIGNRRTTDQTGGIRFEKKLGNRVAEGDILAVCFGKDMTGVEQAASSLAPLIKIGEESVSPPNLFHD